VVFPSCSDGAGGSGGGPYNGQFRRFRCQNRQEDKPEPADGSQKDGAFSHSPQEDRAAQDAEDEV
jgi:hypothetical protein